MSPTKEQKKFEKQLIDLEELKKNKTAVVIKKGKFHEVYNSPASYLTSKMRNTRDMNIRSISVGDYYIFLKIPKL